MVVPDIVMGSPRNRNLRPTADVIGWFGTVYTRTIYRPAHHQFPGLAALPWWRIDL